MLEYLKVAQDLETYGISYFEVYMNTVGVHIKELEYTAIKGRTIWRGGGVSGLGELFSNIKETQKCPNFLFNDN